MEHIIELNSDYELKIPSGLIEELDLKPGSHFTATSDGAKLIIEWVPFSSDVQAKSLNKTIENLQKR